MAGLEHTKSTFELNNGLKMPAVGLGTWQSKPGQVRSAETASIIAML